MYSTLETYSTVFGELLRQSVKADSEKEIDFSALQRTCQNTALFADQVMAMVKTKSLLDKSTCLLSALCDVLKSQLNTTSQKQFKVNRDEVINLCRVFILNVVRILSMDNIVFINTFALHLHSLDQEAKRMLSAKDKSTHGQLFTKSLRTVQQDIENAKKKTDDVSKNELICEASDLVIRDVQQFLNYCLKGFDCDLALSSSKKLTEDILRLIELLRKLHEDLFTRITEGRDEETLVLDRVRDIELFGMSLTALHADSLSASLTGFGDIDEQVAISVMVQSLQITINRASSLLESPQSLQMYGSKARTKLAKKAIATIEAEVALFIDPQSSLTFLEAISRFQTVLDVQFPVLCSNLRPFSSHCHAEIQRIEQSLYQALVDFKGNKDKSSKQFKLATTSVGRLFESAKVLLECNLNTVSTEHIQFCCSQTANALTESDAKMTDAIAGTATEEELRTNFNRLEKALLDLSMEMAKPKMESLLSVFAEYFMTIFPFTMLKSLTSLSNGETADTNALCIAAVQQFKALDQYVKLFDSSQPVDALTPIEIVKAVKVGEISTIQQFAFSLCEMIAGEVLRRHCGIDDPEVTKSLFAKRASISVEDLHCELYRPNTTGAHRCETIAHASVSVVTLVAYCRIIRFRNSENALDLEDFASKLEGEMRILCSNMCAIRRMLQNKSPNDISVRLFVPNLIECQNAIERISVSVTESSKDTIRPSNAEVIRATLAAYSSAKAFANNSTDAISDLETLSSICKRLAVLKYPNCGAEIQQCKLQKRVALALDVFVSSLKSTKTLTESEHKFLIQLIIQVPQISAWCARILKEINKAKDEWKVRMVTRSLRETLNQLVQCGDIFATEFPTEFEEKRFFASDLAIAEAEYETMLSKGTTTLAEMVDEDGMYPFDTQSAIESQSMIAINEAIAKKAENVISIVTDLIDCFNCFCFGVSSIKMTKKYEGKRKAIVLKESLNSFVANFVQIFADNDAKLSTNKSLCVSILSHISNEKIPLKELRKQMCLIDVERAFVNSALKSVLQLIELRRTAENTTKESVQVQTQCLAVVSSLHKLLAISDVYKYSSEMEKKKIKKSIEAIEKHKKVFKKTISGRFERTHTSLNVIAEQTIEEILSIVNWNVILVRSAVRCEHSCLLFTLLQAQLRDEEMFDKNDVNNVLRVASEECKTFNLIANVYGNRCIGRLHFNAAPETHTRVLTTLTLASQAIAESGDETENVVNDIRHCVSECLSYLGKDIVPQLVDNAKECERVIEAQSTENGLVVISKQLSLARARISMSATPRRFKRSLSSVISTVIELALGWYRFSNNKSKDQRKNNSRLVYLCHYLASDETMPFVSDTDFALSDNQYLTKLKATVAELIGEIETHEYDEVKHAQIVNLAFAERALLNERMLYMEEKQLSEAKELHARLDEIIEHKKETQLPTFAEFTNDKANFFSQAEFVSALSEMATNASMTQLVIEESPDDEHKIDYCVDKLSQSARAVQYFCVMYPEAKAKNSLVIDYLPKIRTFRQELEQSVEEQNLMQTKNSASNLRSIAHNILTMLCDGETHMHSNALDHAISACRAYQVIRDSPFLFVENPSYAQQCISEQDNELYTLSLFLDTIASKTEVEKDRKQKEKAIYSLLKHGDHCKRSCEKCFSENDDKRCKHASRSCADMQIHVLDGFDKVIPLFDLMVEHSVQAQQIVKRDTNNLDDALEMAKLCVYSQFFSEALSSLLDRVDDAEFQQRLKGPQDQLFEVHNRLKTHASSANPSKEALKADLAFASETIALVMGAFLGKEEIRKRLIDLIVINDRSEEENDQMKVLLVAAEASGLDKAKLEKLRVVRADVAVEGMTEDNANRIKKTIAGTTKLKLKKPVLNDPSEDLFVLLKEIHKKIDELRSHFLSEKKKKTTHKPLGCECAKTVDRLIELHLKWMRLIVTFTERNVDCYVECVTTEKEFNRIPQLLDMISVDNENGKKALNFITFSLNQTESNLVTPKQLSLYCLDLLCAVDGSALRVLEPEAKARDTLATISRYCSKVCAHPRKVDKYAQKVVYLTCVFNVCVEVLCSPAAANETLRIRLADDILQRRKRLCKLQFDGKNLPKKIDEKEANDKKKRQKCMSLYSQCKCSANSLALFTQPLTISSVIALLRRQMIKFGVDVSHFEPKQLMEHVNAFKQSAKVFEKTHKLFYDHSDKKKSKEKLKQLRKLMKSILTTSKKLLKKKSENEITSLVNTCKTLSAEIVLVATLPKQLIVKVFSGAKVDIADMRLRFSVNTVKHRFLRRLQRYAYDIVSIGSVCAAKVEHKQSLFLDTLSESETNIRLDVDFERIYALCEKVCDSITSVDSFVQALILSDNDVKALSNNQQCFEFVDLTETLIAELLRTLPPKIMINVDISVVDTLTHLLTKAKIENANESELEERKKQVKNAINEFEADLKVLRNEIDKSDEKQIEQTIGELTFIVDKISTAKTSNEAKVYAEQAEDKMSSIRTVILPVNLTMELYENNEQIKSLLASTDSFDPETTLVLTERQRLLCAELEQCGHDEAIKEARDLLSDLGKRMYEIDLIDDSDLAVFTCGYLAPEEQKKTHEELSALDMQTLSLIDDINNPQKLKDKLDLLARVNAAKSKAKPKDLKLLRQAQLLSDMYQRLLGVENSNDLDEIFGVQSLMKQTTLYGLDELLPMRPLKDITVYANETNDKLKKNEPRKAVKKAHKLQQKIDNALKRADLYTSSGHPSDQLEAELYVNRVAHFNKLLSKEIANAEEQLASGKQVDSKAFEVAVINASQSATEMSPIPSLASVYVTLDAIDNSLNKQFSKNVSKVPLDELVVELFDALERVHAQHSSAHPVERLRAQAIMKIKKECEHLVTERKKCEENHQNTKSLDDELAFLIGSALTQSHALTAVHEGINAHSAAAANFAQNGKKNCALNSALSIANLCDAETLFTKYTNTTTDKKCSVNVSLNGQQLFSVAQQSKLNEVAKESQVVSQNSQEVVEANELSLYECAKVNTVLTAAEVINLLQKEEKTPKDRKMLSVALPQLFHSSRSLAKKMTSTNAENAENANKLIRITEQMEKENAHFAPLHITPSADKNEKAKLEENKFNDDMVRMCEALIILSAEDNKMNTLSLVASIGTNANSSLCESLKESGNNTKTDNPSLSLSLKTQQKVENEKATSAASAKAVSIIGKRIAHEQKQSVEQSKAEGKVKKAENDQRALDKLNESLGLVDKQLNISVNVSDENDPIVVENAHSLTDILLHAVATCNPEATFLDSQENIDDSLGQLRKNAKSAQNSRKSNLATPQAEIDSSIAFESAANSLSRLAAHRAILEALANDEEDKNEQIALKASAEMIGKSLEPLVEATASSIYEGNDEKLSAAIAAALAPSKKARADVQARRQRKTPPGMEDDEILAAAFTIEDHVDEQGLDENRTVVQLGALDLSDLMQQLAICAKTNNRKQVLEIRKLLAQKVQVLCARAREVPCPNPRIAKAMEHACSTASNHTIQLSILCNVKAASMGEDPTMKGNLVNCAKEIAKAVIEMMKLEKVAYLMQAKEK